MEFSSTVVCAKDFVYPTYDKVWETFFAKMQAVDVYVRDHCGMHVHVAASALTKLEIAKLNYFVVRNQSLCEVVAHRGVNTYCEAKEHTAKQIKEHGEYKYNMMGLRLGTRTIEFRFFKSTWNYKCFLQNMQFVCAMLAMVKSGAHSLGDYASRNGSMTKALADYVKANKIEFPHLYKFLVLKKYIAKPDTQGRRSDAYKAKLANRFAVSRRASTYRNARELWAEKDASEELSEGRAMTEGAAVSIPSADFDAASWAQERRASNLTWLS